MLPVLHNCRWSDAYSGLHSDEIKIEYVGLRPGEKLYEELLADDEHTMPTPHEKLRIAQARNVDNIWVKNLLKWLESIENTNEAVIKNQLKLWVEEYSPQHQASVDAHFIVDTAQNTLH